jgi:hypothetical protein
MKLSTLLARGYNATKVVTSVTAAVAKNTVADIKSEATRLEREKAQKLMAKLQEHESQ